VAVEPAAWADSDMARRPAAPRSAVRTIFMFETSLVVSAETTTYSSEVAEHLDRRIDHLSIGIVALHLPTALSCKAHDPAVGA
jgi:hypothetical protein